MLCMGLVFVMCTVMFVACAGPQGRQGVAGKDGEIVNYMDVLEFLWKDMTVQERNDKYGGDFAIFVAEWTREHIKGDQGPPGESGNPSIQYAANLAVLSAVEITARRDSPSSQAFSYAGSGVIYQLAAGTGGAKYSGDGYIITNYHVVAGAFNGTLVPATDIRVFLYGMTVGIPVTFMGGSEDHDIAVLSIKGITMVKIDGENRTAQWILNNLVSVRPADVVPHWEQALGTQVIAVGDPLGMGMNVSEGIISVASEDLEMARLNGAKVGNQVRTQIFRVMRITAAINPGNSGGGLFNARGELVGIIQARMFWADTTTDYPVDNMAYAIPLDVSLRITEQIISRAVAGETLPIIYEKKAYSFEVKAREQVKVEYDTATKLTTITETVYVSKAGNGLPTGTEISTITIGTKVYKITRAYQVDELMIEGYGQTVKVNSITI